MKLRQSLAEICFKIMFEAHATLSMSVKEGKGWIIIMICSSRGVLGVLGAILMDLG